MGHSKDGPQESARQEDRQETGSKEDSKEDNSKEASCQEEDNKEIDPARVPHHTCAPPHPETSCFHFAFLNPTPFIVLMQIHNQLANAMMYPPCINTKLHDFPVPDRV